MTKARAARYGVILPGLFLCLSLPVAGADETAKPEQIPAAQANAAGPPPPVCTAPTYLHVVGEHGYLPSLLLHSPFADTNAQVSLLGGKQDLPSPISVGSPDLEVGSFSPALNASIALTHGLAIFFGVAGNLSAGINSNSALVYGAATGYSLSLGLLYEMIRDESNVFSVAFEVSRPHAFSVSPLQAANTAVSSFLARVNPNYFASDVLTVWRPGLRYVHTFFPWLGMLADGTFQLLSTNDENTTLNGGSRVNIGVGPDIDFGPLVGVPIGFSFQYLRAQALSSDVDSLNTIAFGLFTTVGNTFSFGGQYALAGGSGRDTSVFALLLRSYYN